MSNFLDCTFSKIGILFETVSELVYIVQCFQIFLCNINIFSHYNDKFVLTVNVKMSLDKTFKNDIFEII